MASRCSRSDSDRRLTMAEPLAKRPKIIRFVCPSPPQLCITVLESDYDFLVLITTRIALGFVELFRFLNSFGSRENVGKRINAWNLEMSSKHVNNFQFFTVIFFQVRSLMVGSFFFFFFFVFRADTFHFYVFFFLCFWKVYYCVCAHTHTHTYVHILVNNQMVDHGSYSLAKFGNFLTSL